MEYVRFIRQCVYPHTWYTNNLQAVCDILRYRKIIYFVRLIPVRKYRRAHHLSAITLEQLRPGNTHLYIINGATLTQTQRYTYLYYAKVYHINLVLIFLNVSTIVHYMYATYSLYTHGVITKFKSINRNYYTFIHVQRKKISRCSKNTAKALRSNAI